MASATTMPSFSPVESKRRGFRVIKLDPVESERLDLVERMRTITDDMVTALDLSCDTPQLQHIVESLEQATQITAHFCTEEASESGRITNVTIHELSFTRDKR